MHKTLLATALLAACLAACASAPASTETGGGATATEASAMSPADAKFADLSKRWLDGWLALNPVNATQVGDHRFDDQLDQLDAPGRQRVVDFSKAMLGELDAIDVNALSRENQVDAAILRNQLQGDIWNIETYQGWAWDPQVYSGLAGGAIYNLMARDFAPMPQRLKSATARMRSSCTGISRSSICIALAIP